MAGSKEKVFSFKEPKDIADKLKDLDLDKATDVVVIAHGRRNGGVVYNLKFDKFTVKHWQMIAAELPHYSRINIVSCSTAAGAGGKTALKLWSKKTRTYFTAYDVVLKKRWRHPGFEMKSSKGHLCIAYPSAPEGEIVFKRLPNKEYKYFYDIVKKK